MKIRLQDVLFVACTAVLTALIAGPLLAPGVARAVEDEALPTEPAPTPALTVDGLTLTLALDKTSYAPGQVPVLTLVADNAGEATAAADVTVRMRTLTARSMGSRMPTLPRETWTQPVSLSVDAGKSTSLKLDFDTALTAGTGNWFEIQVGEQTVMAARVSLVTQPPVLQVQSVAPVGAAPVVPAPEAVAAGADALADEPIVTK